MNNNISLSTDASLSVNVGTVVSTEAVMRLMGTDTELKVKISADFKDIPAKYHGDYFRTFGYTYNKDTSIWGNSDNDKATVPIIPKKGIWEKMWAVIKDCF
jgi:hypothetical protein